MKNFDDLVAAVLAVLPDAVVEEDAYGQLVVHTGLRETLGGKLAKFEPDEDGYDDDETPQKFNDGDRVIWTGPDGDNELTGTVRSDLDHDGQYWVHFDGTHKTVQTEVYANELRLV